MARLVWFDRPAEAAQGTVGEEGYTPPVAARKGMLSGVGNAMVMGAAGYTDPSSLARIQAQRESSEASNEFDQWYKLQALKMDKLQLDMKVSEQNTLDQQAFVANKDNLITEMKNKIFRKADTPEEAMAMFEEMRGEFEDNFGVKPKYINSTFELSMKDYYSGKAKSGAEGMGKSLKNIGTADPLSAYYRFMEGVGKGVTGNPNYKNSMPLDEYKTMGAPAALGVFGMPLKMYEDWVRKTNKKKRQEFNTPLPEAAQYFQRGK